MKKKFLAKEVDLELLPLVSMVDDLCRVSVDIVFKDGKGFSSSVMVAYRGYGAQLLEVRYTTTTWLTLLRKMEREANCLKKAAFFSLHGCNIFGPGDSIERLLVEMTLENGRI